TTGQSCNSQQPASPVVSRSDQNIESVNNTPGISLQTTAVSSSCTGICLARLLPPPVPSALILNPVAVASLCEGMEQQEHGKLDETDANNDKSANKYEINSRFQQSFPSLKISVDNEKSNEEKGKRTVEQHSEAENQHHKSDDCQLGNKILHDVGSHDSADNELSSITSNRIEEIANTLVNVLQHHSKASTSTTFSTPSDVLSGAHNSHLSNRFIQKSNDDVFCAKNSSRVSSKRCKWPWGNDPIKNHCAIPLDGSANRTKDPRQRQQKAEPHSVIILSLPKFVHDHHSYINNAQNAFPDSFRSSLHQKRNSKRSKIRNMVQLSNSPSPQNFAERLAHSSVSRSESSNSEVMLSPDLSCSATQISLVASTIDIFGDTSPANNSSAYRERLDALAATFQNIEQKFQKTKQNSNLDYDRKVSLQRIYKFEEELERLKARTVPSSAAAISIASTCSNPTSSTYSDSFPKSRMSGNETTSTTDSRNVEIQKSSRIPLSVSIPLQSFPVSSITSSIHLASICCTSNTASNLPSPQFTNASLRKPVIISSSQNVNNQSNLRVTYPPNFCIPPPPLPQPPVPPTLSSTTCKPAPVGTTLISAPPPPPPLMTDTTFHSNDSSSSNHISLLQPSRASCPQMNLLSSSWKMASKPSTPPPPSVHPFITPKQFSSPISTPKSVSAGSGITAAEVGKVQAWTQGADKIQIKDKEHVKMSSKLLIHEKKVSKDYPNKRPSLSELFRQQAQDSSKVRKKQFKKVPADDSSELKHDRSEVKQDKPSEESQKETFESAKDKEHVKAEKKERLSQQKVEKVSGKKHSDGRASQERKSKSSQLKQRKDKNEKAEVCETSKNCDEGEEHDIERKAERSVEKNSKRSKQKEKEKRSNDCTKKRQEEQCKGKEQDRKKKELMKRRKRKKESSTSSSKGTSSSEVELHSFDRELKRLFMEEEASGFMGLSMYDRVKQRSSSKPDDMARKNRALELLQERTQSRRNEQNRPKRVQLESSSSDENNLSDGQESDNSSVCITRTRGSKKKKPGQKRKATKKSRAVVQKKPITDEETEFDNEESEAS
ncbi:unnamed protein product, partial [Thelazia callipaeda]|uniref:WH2 domain-containing protein n=1 Tax=Thelazia callipaeda TaxID=103827 RepID=A0A0N5CMZ4_THECL